MDKILNFFTSPKFLKTCGITFLSLITLLLAIYVGVYVFDKEKPTDQQNQAVEEQAPQGLMLLIEFEDTVGLNNFAYQMREREIPGLLMVNADYVEENCEFLRGLQDHYDIEIAGVCPGEPFWDIPYEEQYETMKLTKDRIEACTGTKIRVMGSQYFAYDENTLKAADELGIPYVFARGTTGPKATIYQPEEYEAKIFSVSNIDSPKWGTGSLCDYSYWAREGNPQDFMDEVYKAFENYDKVSPVSHTYIGGAKARWNEVYMDMFENIDVNWVTLVEFGEVDVYDSIENIPVNREVQYTTPKPEIPLDEEVDLDNPCEMWEAYGDDIENYPAPEQEEQKDEELVIFHNDTGPMCLEAIQFLEDNGIAYTEYLITDTEYYDKFNSYKEEYGDESEGVSTSFGYFPMIFYKGRAFSGFNEDIGETLLNL
ncbi:MAG: Uncharacterized protein XD93_0637 [candidate division WS6 bacterium 34_10]|uniref:Uncharacterized protein n=1 Tax=candidate division WS6 bacterium 34_10 TaxID=1641389 RepID=A0A101HHI0_9BACT|nr:MAG: Uncharacterized protein XD93_0637 [candidate division WS6 bacterium 34_10]